MGFSSVCACLRWACARSHAILACAVQALLESAAVSWLDCVRESDWLSLVQILLRILDAGHGPTGAATTPAVAHERVLDTPVNVRRCRWSRANHNPPGLTPPPPPASRVPWPVHARLGLLGWSPPGVGEAVVVGGAWFKTASPPDPPSARPILDHGRGLRTLDHHRVSLGLAAELGLHAGDEVASLIDVECEKPFRK